MRVDVSWRVERDFLGEHLPSCLVPSKYVLAGSIAEHVWQLLCCIACVWVLAVSHESVLTVAVG
jgi:hypothetical protein